MAVKKIKNKNTQASGGSGRLGGVFTKIGESLGLKKSKREELMDEHKLIDAIIRENERLSNRMKAISFRAKNMPAEQMASDQRTMAMLIVKLGNYDISSMPDTREIDGALYKLCDELEDAYQKGDHLTTRYILQTFIYAIVNGHKPLLENEKEREDAVMQRREQKVQTYLKITQATKNIFQCGCSIDANTKKKQKDVENLKAKMEEIDAFKNDKDHPENAAALEVIQNVGGRMNKLTGPALELASMMQSAVRIFKESELLTKQVSLTKTEMNDYRTLVSQMEINLNEPNIEAKKELIEYAKELGNELLVKVNDQVKDIIDTNAVVTDYFNSMDAVFEQPALEEYILGSLSEYEKMERRFAEDKAAAARAMERDKINVQELEEAELSMDNG